MSKNKLITAHFALLEFTESPTAKKHGIDNTPPQEAVENLKHLCVGTLEPLREALGLPVIITSGYRCKALNDILTHASGGSQHLKGQAADFYVGWGTNLNGRGQSGPETIINSSKFKAQSSKFKAQSSKFKAQSSKATVKGPRERLIMAFRLILTSPSIDFDQLILYPNFIHVSYVAPASNRHSIMIAQANGKYKAVTFRDALAGV